MEDIGNVEDFEIEVTSEMIESGVEVLEWFDSAEASPEMRREIVSEIYEIMARLKCDHQGSSSESSNCDSANPSPIG